MKLDAAARSDRDCGVLVNGLPRRSSRLLRGVLSRLGTLQTLGFVFCEVMIVVL